MCSCDDCLRGDMEASESYERLYEEGRLWGKREAERSSQETSNPKNDQSQQRWEHGENHKENKLRFQDCQLRTRA